MAFYESNIELVVFIQEAFDFPAEMIGHLIKNIPSVEDRCAHIVQLCMSKYVVGNNLALPENATRFIAEESKKGPDFVNAFLAYAVLRRFGASAGANYTVQ